MQNVIAHGAKLNEIEAKGSRKRQLYITKREERDEERKRERRWSSKRSEERESN